MDFLRKYVFHNFSLKLLSLASAFLLWSAVANEPIAEVAHDVPIEFEHVPNNLIITAKTVPQAQIWIRGPQKLVRDVNPGDLHLTIDLAKIRDVGGEHSFALSPKQIHAPFGVSVVEVVPSEIRLTLTPSGQSAAAAPGGPR